MEVHPSLGKKQDPISKITGAQRVGIVAHIVEHLPSKYKIQSWVLSPNKQTNKKS
jgi:hypothetical protein